MAGRKNRFAFGAPAALLVGVAVLIFACVAWGPQPPDSGPDTNGTPATSPTPAPEARAAELRYRKSVQSLFEGWKTSRERKDFATLSNDVLALTVPARYRTLHLDLVIALNYLRDGTASSDQANIEEGLSLLEKIFAANPWMLEHQP